MTLLGVIGKTNHAWMEITIWPFWWKLEFETGSTVLWLRTAKQSARGHARGLVYTCVPLGLLLTCDPLARSLSVFRSRTPLPRLAPEFDVSSSGSGSYQALLEHSADCRRIQAVQNWAVQWCGWRRELSISLSRLQVLHENYPLCDVFSAEMPF